MDLEKILRVGLYVETSLFILNSFFGVFDPSAFVVVFGFLAISLGERSKFIEFAAFTLLSVFTDVIRFGVFWKKWMSEVTHATDFFKFMVYEWKLYFFFF
jgi:hypothetical protein